MQWTSTAGPRQTKAVNQALRDLEWKAKSYREITDYSPEGHILTPMFTGSYCPGYAEAFQTIGDKYDWTATRENYAALVADLEAAKAALEIQTVDKRTTPEQREEMARERAENDKRREEEGRQHKIEFDNAVAELRARYPWAKPATATDARGRQISTHARAAANLREELRRTFPGVAFSVRSDSFSMGNSVDVGWELGPTTAEVDAIAGKYQHGHFDGMQDLYEDDHSAYGSAVESVLGRSKYVSCQRGIPDEAREIVGRALCELQHKDFTDLNDYHLYGDGDYSTTIGEHVYRMFRECSLPAGATVTGAEHIPEADHDKYRQPYRVAFTVPAATAVAAAEEPQAAPAGCEIQKHKHTKRGFDMWLVVPVERLTEQQFQNAKDVCGNVGGWYSRKWGRTPGGFAFKSPEQAQEFAARYFGAQAQSTTSVVDPMGVDAAHEDSCRMACGL